MRSKQTSDNTSDSNLAIAKKNWAIEVLGSRAIGRNQGYKLQIDSGSTMLRKILDFKLSFVEKGRRLHKLRPLVTAADTFFYEAPINTSCKPHIRDSVDIKRWMLLVVFAMLPCMLMAIWNTGLQKFVYGSGDFHLMNEYFASSQSFSSYFGFAFQQGRWLTILSYGLTAFLPVLLISFAVGGLWEALFACIRGHEIAEGFLVTAPLYALILPSSIPYWMVAVGVSAGVVLSKELFGGTGMNILNPALTCRAFLFFSFPGRMSGDVWVGTNPIQIKESLLKMNREGALSDYDGYTQVTEMGIYNIDESIARIHVDAIAANTIGPHVKTMDLIQKKFEVWSSTNAPQSFLGQLDSEQLRQFVTGAAEKGGLGLGIENYQAAYSYASLQYGIGQHTDANFFFGNMLGSMGETSFLACLIGALILIWTGIGSWRTIVAVFGGAFLTALLFQMGAEHLGADSGAWNPAKYSLPAYKHLLLGGLAFGAVFMATDPVSSAGMPLAKWIYGLLIGMIVIVIRAINPAYPEGMMLAILLGNTFMPLIDYYTVRKYRRMLRVKR